MSMKGIYRALALAGIVVLPACLSQPDEYRGAYFAECRFDVGDGRSNILGVGQATASKLGLPLKVVDDSPSRTFAVIDLPLIAGASPYRQGSSGQVLFERELNPNAPTGAVVINGSLKKDMRLIASIRATVEEELKRRGCDSWKFDISGPITFL